MGEEKKWRRSWRDGSVAMLLVVVSVVGVLMCRQVVGVHASSEDDDGYDFAVMLADAMLNQQFDLQESILRDYVKYPSVSALHDKHANDTRKCAEWLRSNIRDNLGMIDADLYETDHYNPVVVGSTLGMNYMDYPSIIVYGHYDVQPVDPLDEWLYDPFDMRMGDMKNVGKVYLGRGVSDDKGGTWSVISSLAMINNVLKGGLARLPINIILVIEGEEEIGSPGFRYFLEQNKEMFRTAEMVISVDGGQPHRDKGSLTLSFRGMMAGQIDVKGADIDLHSGKFGGSILNPVVALTRIVGSLHDPISNKINVDGWYDSVEEFSKEEREELERVSSIDEKVEIAKLGLYDPAQLTGELGYTTAERRAMRPTIEVVGIYGGFREEGIKTVLPSLAHAKISFRMAKGQDPETLWSLFEEHIAKVSPVLAPGCTVTLQRFDKGAPAYIADRESPGFTIAGEVFDEVYQKPHTYSREGGSINAVALFKEVVGLDTVAVSFQANDDGMHGPNERFRLADMAKSQAAYVRLFLKLARHYSEDKLIFETNATKQSMADLSPTDETA